MKAELLEALKCREERIEVAGRFLVVRELTAGDKIDDLSGDPDAAYKLVVLCTFDADGNRVFADEDIPALKSVSRGYVKQLMEIVNRMLADGNRD